jgi:Set1/Ash2 histone methyltransferase complex subunit ASH2
MCITAIANLMQASIKEGNPRTMFSKDMDIIPFIEGHWEGMTTMSRRVTQSWHATVREIFGAVSNILNCLHTLQIQRTLVKEAGVFFLHEESPAPGGNPATLGHPLFGLINQDLNLIKPNYESMVKSGALKITNAGGQKGIQQVYYLIKCIIVQFLERKKSEAKTPRKSSGGIFHTFIFNQF